MNGECKSYRLNDPMTREELLSMPDDLKIVYIQAIRKKYGIPDSPLGKAMGFTQQRFAKLVKRLGLCQGKEMGGRRKWNEEGFYAWWHGVDQLPTPVIEEPTEEPVIEEVPVNTSEEPEAFVEEDIPWNAPETKQDYTYIAPDAEIEALRKWNDELLKEHEKLMAVHEKDTQEITYLRNKCDNYHMNARILEAQMDVVRLIFGGKNNG